MTKAFRHIKLFSLLVLLVSCSTFGVGPYSNTSKSTVEYDSPVNDVKGDYLIEFWDDYSTRRGIKIIGDYDTNPVVGVSSDSNPIGANGVIDVKSMFSIYPVEGVLHNGYQAYYISSPGDASCRFTVKNNALDNGELCFSKENDGSNNLYQQIHIAYASSDYEYRLFFYDSELANKYFITFDSSKVCLTREEKVNNENHTIFLLWDIVGQEALGTGLYISTGTDRYDINSLREVGRVAEEPKTSYPKFSKPFTFALNNGGSQYVDITMDSNYKKHFSIPYYSDRFQINASFVYQYWHKNNGDFNWAQYMDIDAREDGRSWRLETMKNYLGEGDSNGKFVIQKYMDNAWVNVYTVDYPDGNYYPEFSLNWSEHLSTFETKFRIYFAYSIMSTARICRDIFLISDEFYVSYGDVSVNDDFLPILVNSLDTDTGSTSEESSGYSETSTYSSKTSYMWGDAYNVLTKDSLTKKGFKVKPLLNGYECHVSNDKGTVNRDIYYGEEASFNEVGAYTVTVKESARPEVSKSYRLYVSGESVSDFLFGNIFSKKDMTYSEDNPYFIRGTRIAVGYSNEDLGIEDTSGYIYPTYLDSVKIRSKTSLNYASSIDVKIYRNEELINEFDSNPFLEDYEISDIGLYHIRIELKFSQKSGVNCAYDFYFHIANNIIDNTINYKLITCGTHEYYDLSSVVYIVNASYGPLAKDDYITVYYFDENGVKQHEERIKYVVFGTYMEAYNYAMGQINLLMIQQEDGYYYYFGGHDYTKPYTEYEAYKFISSEAKSKVVRTYLTPKDINGFINDVHGHSFEYPSIEDLPDRLLVTYRKEDLERATHREIINKYQFVTDEDRLVSSNVSLYDANNSLIDANFPYFTKVEDYMKAHNLSSGKYTFVDTAPGMSATVTRSYIESYSNTHNYVNAVTTISSLDGSNEIVIDMEHIETKYTFSGGFNISSIVNELDHYSLLVVTLPNGSEDFESINNVKNRTYTELGTYRIKVSDRVGNYYEFDVEVN